MPARSKSTIPVLIGLVVIIAAGLAWRFTGQPRNKYVIDGQAESHGEWFDAAESPSFDGVGPGVIADGASPRYTHAIHDPIKRQEILRLILAAQAQAEEERRDAAPVAAAAPARGNRDSNNLKDFGRFVDEAIHDDFIPMAQECAKELASRQPDAGGTVKVAFRLMGDTKIGGVVDSANVSDEQSTLHDDKFAECMRESMYGVYFDPPPASAVATLDFDVNVLGDGGIDEDVGNFDNIKDRRGESPPARNP